MSEPPLGPASTDPVAAAVSLLRERWPLTVEGMAAALSELGFGDAASIETAIDLGDAIDDPRVTRLSDGRFVTLDAVLDGRMWTHRLTAQEIAADAIELFDVLLPVCVPSGESSIRAAFPGEEQFEERGLVGVDWARLGVLLFPENHLAETVLGDLILVTVRDGEYVVDLYPGQAAGRGTLGDWATERAVRLADPNDSLYVETELLVALADDRRLARDMCLPLTEQLEAAGLVRDGHRLVRSGTVTESPSGGYLVEVATDSFSRVFDLDTRSARAAMAFLALAGSLAVGSDSETTVEAHFEVPGDFAGLADPRVARLCADEALGRLGFDPQVVASAAEQVARRGPRDTHASAHWIAGRAAQALGDISEADRRYRAAIVETSRFAPALEDLATLAAVRGDAVGGLLLLEHVPSGASHPMHAFLRRFEPVDRPDLGRNDPCWCGSGRKFKACHLGRTARSLSERAVWLYAKASVVLDEPQWTTLRSHLDPGDPDEAGDSGDAGVSQLVADVTLFEAGALDAFVETWSQLLPDDERTLVQQWRGAELGMFVVDGVEAGEGLRLRDVRTGQTRHVHDRTASAGLDGATVCLRPLAVGTEWHNYGGVRVVGDESREAVLELLGRSDRAPAELVRLLAGA